MIESLYLTLQKASQTEAGKELKTYAIFDGVKHPNLYKILQDSKLPFDMLFKEENLRKKLKKVAPYVVELDFIKKELTADTEKILELYKKESVMFITSSLALKEQLEYLQQIFYILDENHEVESYFRFYDSEIFNTLLYNTNKLFLKNLFKNIAYYWYTLEDEKKELIQVEYIGEEVKHLVITLS